MATAPIEGPTVKTGKMQYAMAGCRSAAFSIGMRTRGRTTTHVPLYVEPSIAGTSYAVPSHEFGFRADDDGTITFSRSENREAPDTLRAVRVGHVWLVKGHSEPLTVNPLKHVRTVRCGARGGNAERHSSGWSSSTVFSIYTYRALYSDEKRAVIASVNGLGPRLFVVDQLESGSVFTVLASTLDETALWDVCSAIAGTSDEPFKQGEAHERSTLFRAFADGRLKRRNVQGVVKVTVQPAPIQFENAGDGGDGGEYRPGWLHPRFTPGNHHSITARAHIHHAS